MSASRPSSSATASELVLDADVLVIGGGPAGCAAALAGAQAGRSVVLADKGYCGTSGAAAASGVGVWYVDPDAQAREEAMASRFPLGGFLAEREWMERTLDETRRQVDRFADWGYPFPTRLDGSPDRTGFQGPEMMRLMRRQVVRARVKVLDHHPALELLTTADGAVAGARGVRRQKGGEWTVRAPAVVLATGGCTFLSGALGCNVLTGDGHLMAAELGAELSGMEFSNAYAMAPAFSSVTKGAIFWQASFRRADGSVIEGAGSMTGRSIIARTLLTEPVYAILDRWPEDRRAPLRHAQPNFFLPFDRMGIDPFTDPFPITLRLEGTMRGTGGLRVTDADCSVGVPGLFAAGDVATRELICGGFTGGGSHNSAWALSSGTWAGQAAARVPAAAGSPAARPAGVVGLAPAGDRDAAAWREVVATVSDEVTPYDRNLFRSGDGLERSLRTLDDAWAAVRDGMRPDGDGLRVRESVAMLAHARWMYRSALERTETRGMHKRVDHPERDAEQTHRLVVGGLDRPRVRAEAVAGAREPVAS